MHNRIINTIAIFSPIITIIKKYFLWFFNLPRLALGTQLQIRENLVFRVL